MNGAFEWLMLALVALSAGVGFSRGMVREVFHIGSWVITFVMIWIFLEPVARWFDSYLSQVLLRKIAAIGLIFVASMIGCWLINHYLIFRFLSIRGYTVQDRMLGLFIGFGRGLVVVGLLLSLGVVFTLDRNLWWSESWIAALYEPIIHLWIPRVPSG